jgi:hypothetical protein
MSVIPRVVLLLVWSMGYTVTSGTLFQLRPMMPEKPAFAENMSNRPAKQKTATTLKSESLESFQALLEKQRSDFSIKSRTQA